MGIIHIYLRVVGKMMMVILMMVPFVRYLSCTKDGANNCFTLFIHLLFIITQQGSYFTHLIDVETGQKFKLLDQSHSTSKGQKKIQV